MNYRKDNTEALITESSVDLFIQILPWIKNATGKIVVIKYGGSAMIDDELKHNIIDDIILLKIIGVNPVIVHGGGKAISDELGKENIPVKFIDGQRVTTDEVMETVKKVLVGKVNQDLVEAFNQQGNLAVGVSGADAGTIIAEPKSKTLGKVGKVIRVNEGYLMEIIRANYIPVIASVAMGEDKGFYNVNADSAAGHIAAAVGAHKIIFLTDVDGLYRDFNDKSTLYSSIKLREVKKMLDENIIDGGMVPKLEACIHALDQGVHRAHIINGTTPHALLLEVLTNKGVGTLIAGDQEFRACDGQAVGSFASKLLENLLDGYEHPSIMMR